MSLNVAAGTLFVLISTYDVAATVLGVSRGAGPVSGRMSFWLWRGMRRLAAGRPQHRLLASAGTTITVSTMLLWFLVAWAGWALILGSATTDTFGERLLEAGTILLGGLGGDNTGMADGWRVVSLIATAHGLFLASLTIAYLIPVVAAVTEKRQLAGHISTLGVTPPEIVTRAWNGKGFGHLEMLLINLVPEISLLAQRHMAYPLVHYFHSAVRYRAAAPTVAALDEALAMIELGVQRDVRPDMVAVRTARAAIGELLETLENDFLHAAETPPPVPELACLVDAGIPTVPQEEFAAAMEEESYRRALLLAMVEHDGWCWDHVAEPERPGSDEAETFNPADEKPLQPVG